MRIISRIDNINDLWRYSIQSNMWTWISGSNSPRGIGSYGIQGIASAANLPGARRDAEAWYTENAIYLFGGFGNAQSTSKGSMGTFLPLLLLHETSNLDVRDEIFSFSSTFFFHLFLPGTMNDLWKFSPSDNTWAWMKGSNLVYASASFGTIGCPDNSNTPGARVDSFSWVGTEGNLWLFGGQSSSGGGIFAIPLFFSLSPLCLVL